MIETTTKIQPKTEKPFHRGTQNLIPLNRKTKAEQKAICSKGGKTVTEKQILAARVREIKKRIAKGQLRECDPVWLLERIENPKAMSMDILNYLDEIKNSLHPAQRVAFINAYNQVMKSVHGEKIHTTNVNVNVSIEEWEKRLIDD